VETRDHPFFIGVQWHPELTAMTHATQQRLFDGLVNAARATPVPVMTTNRRVTLRAVG
jgi:gamma-glutamyl-gamma-aminobutyrate hydrolase PuuD